jgi:hypothetical protein
MVDMGGFGSHPGYPDYSTTFAESANQYGYRSEFLATGEDDEDVWEDGFE